jgi:hypothetical protein
MENNDLIGKTFFPKRQLKFLFRAVSLTGPSDMDSGILMPSVCKHLSLRAVIFKPKKTFENK